MQKQATPETFYNTLVEFLRGLSQRFPNQHGVQTALHTLTMFCAGNAGLQTKLAEEWATFTTPIFKSIKERNVDDVCAAFENSDNSIISGIGAHVIMKDESVDQTTRDNIWKYVQTLTAMSHAITSSEANDVLAAPPQPLQAPAATNQAPPATPPTNQFDIGKILSQAQEQLPKVLSGVNDFIKSQSNESGENPLADILKQMMNPNALQTGLAGNVMANMMEGEGASAMEEASFKSGFTTDEIMRRLERLERIEKARLRRKGGRK